MNSRWTALLVELARQRLVAELQRGAAHGSRTAVRALFLICLLVGLLISADGFAWLLTGRRPLGRFSVQGVALVQLPTPHRRGAHEAVGVRLREHLERQQVAAAQAIPG